MIWGDNRESRRIAWRTRIISVAKRHFFTNGYFSTTMSAIAAELGGSKGTLWHHFPSKEALFAAVIEETATTIPDQIELPSGPSDPITALTCLCRSILDCMLSPAGITMCRLLGPLVRHEKEADAIRTACEHGPTTALRAISCFLQENFADFLWAKDYEAAAIDLLALSSTNLLLRMMWGSSGELTERQKNERARHAARLFFRAYARDPQEFADLESSGENEA